MSRVIQFWLVHGMNVHFGVVLSFCNWHVDLMVLVSRASKAFNAVWRDCLDCR